MNYELATCEQSLIENPLQMYRINSTSGRWYYDTATPYTLYPSVTTIISGAMPTPYALLTLRGDLGNIGYRQYMNIKATYGTMLHKAFAKYLINGKYSFADAEIDWQHLQSVIADALPEVKAAVKKHTKFHIFKNYLASLAHFAKIHNVKPILIEGIVKYDDDEVRFAGAVDLICKMTVIEKGFFGETFKSGARKGEPKETQKIVEVTALIDVKSGTWGFAIEHEIQLHAYRHAAMQTYPGLKIDRVYNLAPKDFVSKLSFSLKDQTESRFKDKIFDIMRLHEVVLPPDRVTVADEIGENPEDAINEIPILDYIHENISKGS